MLSQKKRSNPAKLLATIGVCILCCGMTVQSTIPSSVPWNASDRKSAVATQTPSGDGSVIDGGIAIYDLSNVEPETPSEGADHALSQVHGASVMDFSKTADFRYATDTLRIDITQLQHSSSIYFAIEIWLSDVGQLQSAFASDQFDGPLETVEDIATRHNAVVAVNGDYATFNNGGIILRNGTLYRANRSTRQLLVIDANGDFHIMQTPPESAKESAEAMLATHTLHTLVFGPALVEKGEATTLPANFFISTGDTKEPRSAIGQLGPLHYLWIVVDGRQEGYSKGVSLSELQALFIQHGATTAFNLDGGGSTTLFFNGYIINEPSNGGQRRVADILMIGDK